MILGNNKPMSKDRLMPKEKPAREQLKNKKKRLEQLKGLLNQMPIGFLVLFQKLHQMFHKKQLRKRLENLLMPKLN